MSDTDLETFPGVEQPDAAPEPALLFMSWRAALANVHGRIEDAYGLRRVWFQHAFDAGFTCAQIGEATGLSAAAVHKIIGTQRKRDLDSPVAPASPDNPETGDTDGNPRAATSGDAHAVARARVRIRDAARRVRSGEIRRAGDTVPADPVSGVPLNPPDELTGSPPASPHCRCEASKSSPRSYLNG